MANICEINTHRPHQKRVCRHARKILHSRSGGIIIADGVGLGKTYEALATVAELLSQGEHGKQRKKRKPFSVLILVPPGLVTKWASELEEDNFLKYIKSWQNSPSRHAVYDTFANDVVVLRRAKDLLDQPGQQRYAQHEFPAGCYIVNINLLRQTAKLGRKATQLFKTKWDAVIVDEAHHVAGDLTQDKFHPLLEKAKTKTILLTATPFQLSPVELINLLSDTFGGSPHNNGLNSSCELAKEFYYEKHFREYRQIVNGYFRHRQPANQEHCANNLLKVAAQLRKSVSRHLRQRIIRNPKRDNRQYFFVDKDGQTTQLSANIFELGDEALARELAKSKLIDLNDRDAKIYLDVRNRIAEYCTRHKRTFIASALRQLLSSYGQFHRSKLPAIVKEAVPRSGHPKIAALTALVGKIIENQILQSKGNLRGSFEKVLLFSTFVGAGAVETSGNEDDHGTARSIMEAMRPVLQRMLERPSPKEKEGLSRHLITTLNGFLPPALIENEYESMKGVLQRFAGSRCAKAILCNQTNINIEKRYLKRQLSLIVELRPHGSDDTEQLRRTQEHRERRFKMLYHRYSTHDLVARYDGATAPEDRDRHLRGFNSPYAPLVMVASSVGQEGIDLQKHCNHVIHFDLEWNPAKLEQREGRVDRQGREAKGPVKVYFLICKNTYDERVLHVMVNRMRWHQLLLPKSKLLNNDPGLTEEPSIDAKDFQNVVLDLRPREFPP